MRRNYFPTLMQSLWCIAALAVWLAVTILFVGYRPEHLFLAILIAGLFFASPASRRLVVALIPFALFGISYDWMNLCPNYTVNAVDIGGLYGAEKSLFGISTAAGILTPNEFWALHTHKILDFMAGIFYLCWVPVPILFGLWLYFKERRNQYLHFAIAFLLVNLIGFTFYYIHPAAPPWYVASHGLDFIAGTKGEVAGLGAFDRLTGWMVFDSLYARNSNIFAALPSLHSAYTFVAWLYAMRYRAGKPWCWTLGIISVGIWWTAVYTSHHYIIDVLCGIVCALVGYVILEYILMKTRWFSKFVTNYTRYISYEPR